MQHIKLVMTLLVGIVLGMVAHYFYCKHQDMNQVKVQGRYGYNNGGRTGILSGTGGAGGMGSDY